MKFDVSRIRKDFPVLTQKVYGKPLVYLDNGATTQKPLSVINCINNFYLSRNSSIHRGLHYLSEQATEAYENAREIVKEFINARYSHEVIFTSGTTGSINGIALSFGEKYIHEGDEIVITAMEHHSNIVPWQMLCERKNANLKIIPFSDDGELLLDEFDKLLTPQTKIVAVIHVSNSLGTVNPVEDIIRKSHQRNVPVLIDGAQSVQHLDVDVQKLDCDFFVFSGHKIYGPTGIGILYGKEKWLEDLQPFHGGGEMVAEVTFEKTTYNELPFKFEAGTTNYIAAIALGEALKYVSSIGKEGIAAYESELLEYATKKIKDLGDIKIYGTAKNKISILSFIIGNINPYDAGMIFDKMGVAVRTGTHCAQPVMHRYNIDGTIRASLAMYNTKQEIDILCEAIEKAKSMLA
ncbi:MAG: cysteine desulfurase [Bacteroidales bacterium]|nr:MAG: cysteine desulfurase [Bacteroidales bacterium]